MINSSYTYNILKIKFILKYSESGEKKKKQPKQYILYSKLLYFSFNKKKKTSLYKEKSNLTNYYTKLQGLYIKKIPILARRQLLTNCPETQSHAGNRVLYRRHKRRKNK